MKIVVLDAYTLNPGDLSWESFKKFGEFQTYDFTHEAEIITRIGDADIVLTNKTPINKQTIDACPNIRYIGVLATGYNVVDTEYAKAKGICVTNIPTYGTTAVSQFVFAHLLNICHHIAHHDKAVKAGRWQESGQFCFWDYPLIELAGKKMGIIGFGRIGQNTAKIAIALGMHVLAYDKRPDKTLESSVLHYTELDILLRSSDVISLHCPLLPDTYHIINKDTIAKMKDGVIIINTSRGALINEQDLADSLNNGKVYAAGVDVASKEPIETNNPLLEAKNCIITPHIAWAPKESRARLMQIAEDNIKAFCSGKEENRVNP